MASINFFSPYIQNTKKMKKNINRLISIAMIVFILAGGLAGYNFFRLYMIKGEIKNLEAYLATPEMQAKKKEADTTRLRIDIGNKYFQELQGKESRIKTVDLIKVELMDTLTSTLPTGLVFDNVSINVNSVVLTGKAPSRRAISELEYNLKKTGLFKVVHVSNISREATTGPYSYNLNAAFN